MRRQGFTLLELLVVVSIIALMIAMLMPSLKRARSHARTSACQMQMRQFMLASIAYAADWAGTLPEPNWGTYTTRPGWLYDRDGSKPRPQSGVLWPFLNNFKIYHCPDHQAPWPNNTQQYSSYTMNGSVCGYGKNDIVYKLSAFRSEDIIFWETHEDSTYWNDGSNFPHEFATGRHPLGDDLGAGNIANVDGSTAWLSTDAYHSLAFPSFPSVRNRLWNRPFTDRGW
ncbi:type II secretion system protein [Planctomycetales bacterium ZRK34]|nr:type II secretion system protein [Planctomycetales bacterium ZRK34]